MQNLILITNYKVKRIERIIDALGIPVIATNVGGVCISNMEGGVRRGEKLRRVHSRTESGRKKEMKQRIFGYCFDIRSSDSAAHLIRHADFRRAMCKEAVKLAAGVPG